MEKKRSVRWAAAALAGGALLLTGCAPEPPVLTPVAPPTDPETTEPEVHTLTWYTDQVWNERERLAQAEDIIEGCMAFNGFRYTPEVLSGASPEEPTPEALVEQASEQGYRIADEYEERGNDNPLDISGPNITYFEGLSEPKQQAYLDALEGTQETGFEGCRSEAQLFTMDNDPARIFQDDEFRDLIVALGALPDEINADERIVTLQSEWKTCLRESVSIEADQREDLPEVLKAELLSIGEPSEAALATFREREVSVAVADAECAVDVDWQGRMTEVRDELHASFVDDHLAELEAVVEKYRL